MKIIKIFQRKKMIIWVLALSFVIPLLMILISNWMVENKTSDYLFTAVDAIPENKVGLVLGTAKFLSDGRVNLYYQYRIEATEKLYKSGKIKKVLISGDNSRNSYNEPKLMKDDLIALGIPESSIFLDYAGFRTLDSVVRADKIFGQKSFIVISQKFHNERAIFIAKNKGLEVNGYNARDVSLNIGFKVVLREYLARVKMMIDLYVTKKQPRFLGDAVAIE